MQLKNSTITNTKQCVQDGRHHEVDASKQQFNIPVDLFEYRPTINPMTQNSPLASQHSSPNVLDMLLSQNIRESKLLEFDSSLHITDDTIKTDSRILISNQNQLELFRGIRKIEGTLVITGNVTNLGPLYKLEEISGNIFIEKTKLKDLKGLNNLVRANSVVVEQNNLLTSIKGLESLAYIYDKFELRQLPLLQNLTSLQALKQARTIKISLNNSLTSIQGLKKLYSAQIIDINNCPKLPSLSGLDNIGEVRKGLSLFNLPLIQNLRPLARIRILRSITIGKLDQIQNLDDLAQLTHIFESLTFFDMQNLSSIKQLFQLTQVPLSNSFTRCDRLPQEQIDRLHLLKTQQEQEKYRRIQEKKKILAKKRRAHS